MSKPVKQTFHLEMGDHDARTFWLLEFHARATAALPDPIKHSYWLAMAYKTEH